MQSEIRCEMIVPKPTKKYSIDLSMFGVQRCFEDSELSPDRVRKLTYDFACVHERAENPLEKDIMFQKMNEDGIINEIDLDALF